MPQGVVKWFDARKGFGFIVDPNAKKDIFVHFSSIEGEGFKTLKDGDRVEFEMSDSDRGPQAQHVRRLSQPVDQAT